MLNKLDYNPDVLSCLANLSSDEVFTPPSLANQMLDLLPDSLWRDPNAKFLDPAVKSGVFLREIARRLMDGLAEAIPDAQARRDHIFSKQIYGLAITELTALLTRRSVYCSKSANGKYSVAGGFRDEAGNIQFERIDHDWKNGKCVHCGASESEYARGAALETHAYAFIHMINPEEVLGMKFDVIIGNPPYQLSDGALGGSALPIYHKFIQQAKKLNPSYLSMIVPARWFSGGRGLDQFRSEMLTDTRLRVIHDFPISTDLFPGVQIKGGVCYFLWDKSHSGDCHVITHNGQEIVSEASRPLLEPDTDTFIRFNEAIPILRKVRARNEKSFAELVSANDPFGFDVRVPGSYKRIKPKFSLSPFDGAVNIYYVGWESEGIGYIERTEISKNNDWINAYKVYISQAYGAGEDYPHQILNKPFIGEPNSCCTETYLLIGPFEDKKTAENVTSYIRTKFFRFMVMLVKNTQHAVNKVYKFVPGQDFSNPWTDEKLYAKYDLTEDEIAFIESMIRPMEANGG